MDPQTGPASSIETPPLHYHHQTQTYPARLPVPRQGHLLSVQNSRGSIRPRLVPFSLLEFGAARLCRSKGRRHFENWRNTDTRRSVGLAMETASGLLTFSTAKQNQSFLRFRTRGQFSDCFLPIRSARLLSPNPPLQILGEDPGIAVAPRPIFLPILPSMGTMEDSSTTRVR